MESTPRLTSILILTIIIFITLSACVPTQTLPTPVPATPTATVAPSATVQWFPATSTATPRLVQVSTATPVQMPGIGGSLVIDDFSSGSAWNTSTSDQGNVSVSRNRITIAAKEPDIYIFSLRNEPLITDFYAEINAHLALCKGNDSYGLLFRANNNASYRYALSCNGTVRLERMSVSRARPIHEAIYSGDVPPGSPGDVHLGVWVAGSEMRFFLNGRHQFTATDVNLGIGTIGVFAQTAPENMAMTVTFSNLNVQSVVYVSPTPTPTMTKTPAPTSTRAP
ncbi:MAG: hypothetical protein HN390_08990 [Anaerolineae bacterium]|mgnify:CR=1 FL=1|jgi:hypothetical protein|nr:hypothetical protein [Anaerolineae bacterium]MBT7189809.1 hypothetical protein [Anaerolineae bacterium]MBT7988691.1 hypothetical protein [Anaerolineae bacterium]